MFLQLYVFFILLILSFVTSYSQIITSKEGVQVSIYQKGKQYPLSINELQGNVDSNTVCCDIEVLGNFYGNGNKPSSLLDRLVFSVIGNTLDNYLGDLTQFLDINVSILSIGNGREYNEGYYNASFEPPSSDTLFFKNISMNSIYNNNNTYTLPIHPWIEDQGRYSISIDITYKKWNSEQINIESNGIVKGTPNEVRNTKIELNYIISDLMDEDDNNTNE